MAAPEVLLTVGAALEGRLGDPSFKGIRVQLQTFGTHPRVRAVFISLFLFIFLISQPA